MSWYSKVFWSEGLFLRPHHLQQNDRYLEHLLERRVGQVTPYPWGFSALEIDRDLAQQSKFCLRRATGVMPDGTPFDIPADSPIPEPIDVPESAAGQICWLSIPVAAPNTREVDDKEAESASRYHRGSETFIDSTSALRIEEEIDIAHPRLAFELRKTAKPGYVGLGIARVLEIRDRNILFDEKFIPPMLTCAAHPVIEGWLNRDRRLDRQQARRACRATPPTRPRAAACKASTTSCCRSSTVKSRCSSISRAQATSIPSGCSSSWCGSPANSRPSRRSERRAHDYPAYDHDDLENTFDPLMRDIQDFLSARLGRRAIRLEIIERAHNAFVSPIRDRTLVPQRDAGARSRGAAAADRDPARIPAPVQNRPQHEDERDRARPSCRAYRSCIFRRRRRTSARSPITSISISTGSRRCGLNSALQVRSGCISRASGPILNWNCGRSWKIGDERSAE